MLPDVAREDVEFFDHDGNPVPVDSPDVDTFEITKYDSDDQVISRAYGNVTKHA